MLVRATSVEEQLARLRAYEIPNSAIVPVSQTSRSTRQDLIFV